MYCHVEGGEFWLRHDSSVEISASHLRTLPLHGMRVNVYLYLLHSLIIKTSVLGNIASMDIILSAREVMDLPKKEFVCLDGYSLVRKKMSIKS